MALKGLMILILGPLDGKDVSWAGLDKHIKTSCMSVAFIVTEIQP